MFFRTLPFAFKKSELEKWVNERLSSSSNKKTDIEVQIKNFLSPDRVVFIKSASKRDAIVELANVLANAPQVKNKEELVSEILKREDLMSTSVGKGIAIPHVRLSSVTDLVMAVGICKKEIEDYQSVDGERIELMIMIAAAHNQHTYYLKTIAFLTSKLRDADLKKALQDSVTPHDAYEVLIKD